MQKAHVFEGMGFLFVGRGGLEAVEGGVVRKVIKKCCESVDGMGLGL